MNLRNRLQTLGVMSTLPVVLSLSMAVPALGQAKSSLFTKADSVTAEDPNKIVEASVWLALHDKKTLDESVAKMYRPGSPSYHHWLKSGDLGRFLPTKSDLETVKKELNSKGLKVVSVGPNNRYVKVSGTVAQMQTAFQTEIKSLNVKGESMRATTTAPKMEGTAGSMVAAVTGLSQRRMQPDLAKAVNPDSGKPFPGVRVSSPAGTFYAGNCFRGIHAQTYETPGSKLPVAQYVGNRYGQNITNSSLGTLPPCGYNAENFTTAYGLTPFAYKRGLDGTGQTIVIVDAYGSSTIKDDANTFSSLNGLPLLTDANFAVVYPLGTPQPTSPGNALGWAQETSLDVEWAHAVAPGANIVLLVSPTNFNTDLVATVFYGVANQIGGVISNSYGGAEADAIAFYPQDLIVSDAVAELAAALGISVNYSSGDYGDLEAEVGVKTVSDLGDSPYATSVGGTSMAIYGKSTMRFQTGWGNNITKLVAGNGAGVTLAPLDPPLNEGFIFGAGGGESQFFDKPSWQASLPGVGRQQPDVSMDADPYTGAEIIYSDGGFQYFTSIGGTSLSCPAFSAVWAIANQRAAQIHGDGYLLGQAAPTVANLAGTKAIVDVTAYTSPTNVAGFVFDANGPTFYSADQLAAPLENTKDYLSTMYNGLSGSWYVLTFGTDTSLTVGTGWDNVTGYGTPRGMDFINAAAQ